MASEWPKLSRPGGPVIIEYFENGTVSREVWYQNGQKSRHEGGPVEIWYSENGTIRMKAWYQNDILSRDDGPAMSVYHPDGNVKDEIWLQNGQVISVSG